MKKYKVKNKLEYGVFVLEREGEEFKVMLEFLGVDEPVIGEEIAFSEELLDKTSKYYTQPYAFMYDENILIDEVKFNKKECLTIFRNDKNLVLKRIYG